MREKDKERKFESCLLIAHNIYIKWEKEFIDSIDIGSLYTLALLYGNMKLLPLVYSESVYYSE